MKPAVIGLSILLAACGETDYQGRYTLTGLNGCGNSLKLNEKLIEVRKTNEQYTALVKGRLSNLPSSLNISEFNSIPYSIDKDGNLPVAFEGDNGFLNVRLSMKLEPTSENDNFLLTKYEVEMTNAFTNEVTKQNFLEAPDDEFIKGFKVDSFCLKRTL